MKVLLKANSRVKNTKPEWERVDTRALFNNQYNLVNVDCRVFDSDILAIVDDARINKGRCRYCGAIVKRGHEEEHYKEQESKKCDACWWYRDKLESEERTKNASTEIIYKKYKKVCTYPENGCTNTEHRRMGIEWFTPQNTYFLKYPNGYKQGAEDLKAIIFDFIPVWENSYTVQYEKKFGSYTLTAYHSITGNFEYFQIANCRKHINFLINLTAAGDLDILIYDSTFGYTVHKDFEIWHDKIACNVQLKKFFIERITAGRAKQNKAN